LAEWNLLLNEGNLLPRYPPLFRHLQKDIFSDCLMVVSIYVSQQGPTDPSATYFVVEGLFLHFWSHSLQTSFPLALTHSVPFRNISIRCANSKLRPKSIELQAFFW